MSTTNGPMRSFRVTDPQGNVYIMIPVDTTARTAAYKVGDYVTYKSRLYKCTTAIVTPSSTWDPSSWTETSVDKVINSGSFATKEYVDSMLGNVEQLLSEL